MEYVYFILFILALIGLLILVTKIDARVKNKWRKSAYNLLETESPNLEEIKKTIKGLRLYGGRWRKDKEFVQLVKRLQDKLETIRE
jgi:hypothetical protein